MPEALHVQRSELRTGLVPCMLQQTLVEWPVPLGFIT